MASKRQPSSAPARWHPYGEPLQRSLSFYLLDFSLNLLRFDFFISDILSLSLPTTTYRIRIYRFRGLECYDLSLF